MSILFLGAFDSPLIPFLDGRGESVVSTMEPVSASDLAASRHEYLISYGFRHILREDVLKLFPNRALNLHISLLPWNRGADPNLWSFLENTPKGVTIHRIDTGIDTGEILVRREVAIPRDATLRTSYALLQESICSLFYENWSSLKAGEIAPHAQIGPATVHRAKDKLPHLGALRLGLDTPICEIESYGRSKGLHR